MTEAEINARRPRDNNLRSETAEWISSFEQWSRSEKMARLKSPVFNELRRQGIKKRENVRARNLRIDEIAIKISTNGWLGKSNSWIASRLASDQGLSVNTFRADIAAAKKFLMGSQNPNN
jgi:hypothetical protein